MIGGKSVREFDSKRTEGREDSQLPYARSLFAEHAAEKGDIWFFNFDLVGSFNTESERNSNDLFYRLR